MESKSIKKINKVSVLLFSILYATIMLALVAPKDTFSNNSEIFGNLARLIIFIIVSVSIILYYASKKQIMYFSHIDGKYSKNETFLMGIKESLRIGFRYQVIPNEKNVYLTDLDLGQKTINKITLIDFIKFYLITFVSSNVIAYLFIVPSNLNMNDEAFVYITPMAYLISFGIFIGFLLVLFGITSLYSLINYSDSTSKSSYNHFKKYVRYVLVFIIGIFVVINTHIFMIVSMTSRVDRLKKITEDKNYNLIRINKKEVFSFLNKDEVDTIEKGMKDISFTKNYYIYVSLPVNAQFISDNLELEKGTKAINEDDIYITRNYANRLKQAEGIKEEDIIGHTIEIKRGSTVFSFKITGVTKDQDNIYNDSLIFFNSNKEDFLDRYSEGVELFTKLDDKAFKELTKKEVLNEYSVSIDRLYLNGISDKIDRTINDWHFTLIFSFIGFVCILYLIYKQVKETNNNEKSVKKIIYITIFVIAISLVGILISLPISNSLLRYYQKINKLDNIVFLYNYSILSVGMTLVLILVYSSLIYFMIRQLNKKHIE
ncbi:hypothetical protein BN85401580 [Alteracholeplasma palmae J233]|uniref:Uncharacterized protein n=1 Tax=Alteracholeplasma palmae (strain ATCC 49389 / J233) TaxID=1318466 RepID=U4KNH4_ALTPJ|nr:hypothetical protein [Alteracholeplasma palmae]CCV63735.1 hypothetical protein BN85401580 [Alteracholeplasma palmae J233]